MGLFDFQFYAGFNFGKFINFIMVTVRIERINQYCFRLRLNCADIQ